ncbi:MAG TPA: AIR synthase-related protein [Candidatus Paceibacterota bacterium]|nr:AIR synthase-related protein [Candidatus Paceibacterota bacterium]
MENLTYKKSGVDYDAMDPFKKMCQIAGLETAQAFKVSSNHMRNILIEEYEKSRGESVYLQRFAGVGDFLIAHVHEGLGTKNLVADAMYKIGGHSYYNCIAKDTIAMGANDMITLGALPTSIAMHLSVGRSDWFNDKRRVGDLIEGWKNGCIESGAIWGCGETPTLKDVLLPEVAELSVSVVGLVEKRKLFETSKIKDGDVILLIESSGIHANGLTLARKIAGMLPDGYMTPIDQHGQSFGEALLEPTVIYAPFIQDWLSMGVDIHYAVNITGHGWRKLMRAPQNFSYIIDKLPWQNPIFDFIKEKGNVTEEEMYGNYNMGAGFAVFLSEKDADSIIEFEKENRFFPKHHDGRISVFKAGYIEKSDIKKVVIRPKNLEFAADTLQVR